MASHPFFDAPTYPWKRREAGAFYDLVVQLIDVNLIGQLVPRFGGNLAHLNQNQPPVVVWRDVLNHLTTARGLRGFCRWCEDESLPRGNPNFQTAVRAVVGAVFLPPRRVIDAAGSQLIFDREPVWADVARLAAGEDRARMLLVGGGRRSGKTHVGSLFELAAEERGGAEVIILNRHTAANDKELVDSQPPASGSRSRSRTRPTGRGTRR